MNAKQSATLRYTGMRLGIFALCFLLVWGLVWLGALPAGLGDSNYLWVLVLAIVISAPLSFVLLSKQRAAMSEQIVQKVDRTRGKLAQNRSQEDD